MGVGNYTERDVREAARAFTGWTNDVLEFKFDAAQHDAGEKTFLGRRPDPFNGEDIIDIILEQPVTAEFVSAKLYSYFVREEVSAPVRASLGRTFRDERLPDQAAAEADLPVAGISTARPPTRRRSRVPVQLVVSTYQQARAARACRRFPTSAA